MPTDLVRGSKAELMLLARTIIQITKLQLIPLVTPWIFIWVVSPILDSLHMDPLHIMQAGYEATTVLTAI